MFKKLIPRPSAVSSARAGRAATGRRGGKSICRGFELLEDRHVLSAATLLNEIDVNPPGGSGNRYTCVEIEGTPGASLTDSVLLAPASAQTTGFDDISVPTDPSIAPATGGELFDAAAGYYTSGGTLINPSSTQDYNSYIGETYSVSAFTSDGVQFPNAYGQTDGDWYGWAISSVNGVTFPTQSDYINGGEIDYATQYQYSAYANLQTAAGGQPTGGGGAGSANYGIFYDDGVSSDERLTLPAGASPLSIDVANTTYDALSVMYGDSFSPAFNASLQQQLGASPYLTLTITGFDGGGNQVGTPLAINLASYTTQNGLQIVDQWTPVELSGLAGAAQLQFAVSTNVSDMFGPTVPLSFAADNLILATTTPPSVTSGGTPASYTMGVSPPVAVDPNVQVNPGSDADINEATMVLNNPVSGDTLNFTAMTFGSNTINGSYGSNTLTLTGNATVAEYQTALQSVTFSSSNTVSPSTTPRSVTIQADDSLASPPGSNTITDTVDVTIPHPTVTAGGSAALYTAGANALTVDGGIQVNSDDTSHMTGATVTISSGLQSGDTLSFTAMTFGSNTISGTYALGTLSLSGLATTANYQTALQSVTFNSSSTSTATRSISVQVDDSYASPSTSTPASDTVDVYAPVTVTALYVKGSTWAASFDSYLGSHTLGNSATPSLGYALQTGANQSKILPWVNINVIEATFSSTLNPSSVTQNSLILTGGTGGSTPSVTGFSALGNNTYAWTLSTSLTRNRLEISFLSTGGNAITDDLGHNAGLSGNWTNGSSTFPSGNGLAGTTSGVNTPTSSDFNFLFNMLPGEATRAGSLISASDYGDVRQHLGQSPSNTAYTPYYDVTGAGLVSATSYGDVRSHLGQSLPANAPSPQTSGVGGLTTSGDDADLTGGFLAVQEGSTSQTGGGSTVAASNQTSGGSTSTSSSGSSGSSGGSSSSSSTGSLASDTDATDAAVTDFDLADLYV